MHCQGKSFFPGTYCGLSMSINLVLKEATTQVVHFFRKHAIRPNADTQCQSGITTYITDLHIGKKAKYGYVLRIKSKITLLLNSIFGLPMSFCQLKIKTFIKDFGIACLICLKILQILAELEGSEIRFIFVVFATLFDRQKISVGVVRTFKNRNRLENKKII